MSFSIDDYVCTVTDKSNVPIVASNLRKWGCCLRCIFRILGVKTADFYRQYELSALATWLQVELESTCSNKLSNEQTLANEGVASDKSGNEDAKRTEETGEQITASDSTPCICCFGVLQDKYCNSEFVNGIAKKVLKQGYEFKTFLCSVSLPVSLLIREHAVWLAVDELLPGAFSKEDKNGIATVKDVWKWINGPILASALNVPFDQKSPFEVLLSFIHKENDAECGFLCKLYPDEFRKRKQTRPGWELFNRSNVARAIEYMSAIVFRRWCYCPPVIPSSFADCSPIGCQLGAFFIAGRYNKFSRHLSQTPWVVDGKRKSEFSVEELICKPINEAVLATEWRFSASGREDVDVRMLGNGRPFVIEFINPHRVNFTREQLKQLQETINSSTCDVAVRDLQVVSKDETTILKEGEEDKTKRYMALCWSRDVVPDEKLAGLGSVVNVTLQQRTPLRVLHRRPLATRERTIYSLSAERVSAADHSNYFAVSLSTQAGTYVKEFVHSDLGRTYPSLGTLLDTECDILALDVVAVELDWPKPLID